MRKSLSVLLQISLLCISILPATVEGKTIVTEVFPAQDEFICQTPEISWLIESTEDKEIIMYELNISKPEDEFLFYRRLLRILLLYMKTLFIESLRYIKRQKVME